MRYEIHISSLVFGHVIYDQAEGNSPHEALENCLALHSLNIVEQKMEAVVRGMESRATYLISFQL